MSNPSSASQGGLDLEALERSKTEDGYPAPDATIDALIDRVRELEAEKQHAIHQVGVCSRECNRLLAENASLQRVREGWKVFEQAFLTTAIQAGVCMFCGSLKRGYIHDDKCAFVDAVNIAALADSEEVR